MKHDATFELFCLDTQSKKSKIYTYSLYEERCKCKLICFHKFHHNHCLGSINNLANLYLRKSLFLMIFNILHQLYFDSFATNFFAFQKTLASFTQKSACNSNCVQCSQEMTSNSHAHFAIF